MDSLATAFSNSIIMNLLAKTQNENVKNKWIISGLF